MNPSAPKPQIMNDLQFKTFLQYSDVSIPMIMIHHISLQFPTFQASDKATVIIFSVEEVFIKNLYWHLFLEIVMQRSNMPEAEVKPWR